ncbi:MAG TPA: hypothetical protein VHU89_00290 [Acidobacteriaceae bacterium]|jgi:hypothetical protein|nr:hypothetical protein [Acidobacteriaceae bacterium]
MKEHLPAAVATDPQGGAEAGCAGYRRAIGTDRAIENERGIGGEAVDTKVAEEETDGDFGREEIEDLVFAEDAAGAAEFEELFSKQLGHGLAIATELGLEQAFFEFA